MKHLCCWWLLVNKSSLILVTPGTEHHQAPLSLGFSRQEYWSGLQFLPPRKSVSIATPISMHVCMRCHFSHVLLFVTLWTVAHQAPLSMGFSRQEQWSGNQYFHALLQGIFPTLGSNRCLLSPALAGGFFTTSAAWEALAPEYLAYYSPP